MGFLPARREMIDENNNLLICFCLDSKITLRISQNIEFPTATTRYFDKYTRVSEFPSAIALGFCG